MNHLASNASVEPYVADDEPDYAETTAPIWYPTTDVLSPDIRETLTRTIERDIIPRLLRVRRPDVADDQRASGGQTNGAFSYADVEAFCEAIVRQPLPVAREFIESLIQDGMSIDCVITTVLSSAARHLGLLWDSDRVSFVDVTVGLSRIQQLLRTYGPAFRSGAIARGPGHRIFLAMVPGDQHTFGLSVVEEFFLKEGWDVENAGSSTKAVILDRVHTEWFDVVGLSATGETSREEIAVLIALIRDASMNRHITVVMGGFAFVNRPELAIELGADAGVRDAQEALRVLAQEQRMRQIAF